MESNGTAALIDLSPPPSNAVQKLKAAHKQGVVSSSPGSNPFDDYFKEAATQKDTAPSDECPETHRNSPEDLSTTPNTSGLYVQTMGSNDNTESRNDASSNCDVPPTRPDATNSQSVDCGNESLGILSNSLCRKEFDGVSGKSFAEITTMDGRESLGIFNLHNDNRFKHGDLLNTSLDTSAQLQIEIKHLENENDYNNVTPTKEGRITRDKKNTEGVLSNSLLQKEFQNTDANNLSDINMDGLECGKESLGIFNLHNDNRFKHGDLLNTSLDTSVQLQIEMKHLENKNDYTNATPTKEGKITVDNNTQDVLSNSLLQKEFQNEFDQNLSDINTDGLECGKESLGIFNLHNDNRFKHGDLLNTSLDTSAQLQIEIKHLENQYDYNNATPTKEGRITRDKKNTEGVLSNSLLQKEFQNTDANNLSDINMDGLECGKESLGIFNLHNDNRFKDGDLLNTSLDTSAQLQIEIKHLENQYDYNNATPTKEGRITRDKNAEGVLSNSLLQKEFENVFDKNLSDINTDQLQIKMKHLEAENKSNDATPNVKVKIDCVDKAEEKGNNKFNSSILFEAQQLAVEFSRRVEICNDNDENDFEHGYLDCTPQPDLEELSDIEYEAESFKPVETDVIFKAIDKIFPTQKQSESTGTENVVETSKPATNTDLLNTLSTLLNKEVESNEAKSMGQQIIDTLANILNADSSQRRNEEDDIMKEPISTRETVAPVASVDDCDFSQPLDLSLNKRNGSTKPTHSQSLDLPKPKVKSSGFGSFCSQKLFNFEKKSSSILDNLKPKSNDDRTTCSKKGPLRAVMPLGIMAKPRKSLGTKVSPIIGSSINTNRPVPNFSIRSNNNNSTSSVQQPPIAQSTPERKSLQPGIASTPKGTGRGSFNVSKRKFESPVSPLARPNSLSDISFNDTQKSGRSRSNSSSSIPNLCRSDSGYKNTTRNSIAGMHNLETDGKKTALSSGAAMSRPRSVTDLKSANGGKSIPLRRTGSIGSKSDIVEGSKLLKRLGSFSKKQPEKSILTEINNSIAKRVRPFNLVSKLRWNNSLQGKENAGHN